MLSSASRKELRIKDAGIQLGHASHSDRIDPSKVVQLSWQPRIFLYKEFLSKEECDHLISLAYDKNYKITGSGDDSGNVSISRQLLSSEIPLDMKDDVVARIEQKLSAWTFLPRENSRAMQILHLENEDTKQKYDYYSKNSPRESLVATVVIYLSNVASGGEILFPHSEPKQESWSYCGSKDNPLRPAKGNAVLFFSSQPSASPDERSLHTRCPVLEGEMWTATNSFYSRAVSSGTSRSGPEGSECTDEDENCPRWAAVGECKNNPVFMIGSPDYYGTCRKSCNAC
ncbi:hypothetical protein CDL15_Pgr022956 [Punica granatum]|uniref:procollagen-proline 4-dioxygenase n=1 Tax=Punica granatum TaxID=22663 RepID=A0A218X3Q4_PUNGR|nr:hypothetical protein CDL15_Pgr022956 [Punica granatum]